MAPVGGTAVQDHVALAEIELCGELMIAASAADEERLSLESIDEVLKVAEERARPCGADGRDTGRAAGPAPAR
ncbi:hypothetical protein ACGFS9_29775 [Streptomyces sp. NPDC048566]|uniref:hypothetical protein n=1 Tax=Streptomyces sp. NPDC048566 TaxID=3365569 RepID=UPI003724B52A